MLHQENSVWAHFHVLALNLVDGRCINTLLQKSDEDGENDHCSSIEGNRKEGWGGFGELPGQTEVIEKGPPQDARGPCSDGNLTLRLNFADPLVVVGLRRFPLCIVFLLDSGALFIVLFSLAILLSLFPRFCKITVEIGFNRFDFPV